MLEKYLTELFFVMNAVDKRKRASYYSESDRSHNAVSVTKPTRNCRPQ